MNHAETTRICTAITELSPAQRFHDDTPGFWQVVLADIRYEDARAVLVTLAAEQPFIGAADIARAVKALRTARITGTNIPAPHVDPDDPVAYRAEIAAITQAIADGVFDADAYATGRRTLTGAPVRPALPGSDAKPAAVTAAVTGAFRRPPRPGPADLDPAPRPVRALTTAQAAAEDHERERQLRALKALQDAEQAPAGTETPDGAPQPVSGSLGAARRAS